MKQKNKLLLLSIQCEFIVSFIKRKKYGDFHMISQTLYMFVFQSRHNYIQRVKLI